MSASVKNWLCAAAQTMLVCSLRYAAGGVRGVQANPLAEKKFAPITSFDLSPLYHIQPTVVCAV